MVFLPLFRFLITFLSSLLPFPLFRLGYDASLFFSLLSFAFFFHPLSIQFSYSNFLFSFVSFQAGGCNEREMSVSRIFQLYQSNKQIFQQDAYKVHSTDSQITNLDGLFHVLLNRSEKAAPSNFPIHTTMWRINRMAPARALRTLFRQPNTIPPNAGIDIERYITFDVSGGSTYHLPTTDCSNMFVHQAIGSRVIHLQPTNECAHQCRLLTVKLEQNYTCKFVRFRRAVHNEI